MRRRVSTCLWSTICSRPEAAKATLDLVTGLGGKVHAFAFLIELVGLSGRERLKGQTIHSVLTS